MRDLGEGDYRKRMVVMAAATLAIAIIRLWIRG